MDFEVRRLSRQCATTGRPLEEGETYYSALVAEGAEVRRLDYAAEAWQGPPEGSLGWWKGIVQPTVSKKVKRTPGEVLLDLFHELQEQPDQDDLRYILALLLVRRKIFRLEDEQRTDDGQEQLVVYAPADDETYEVPVKDLADARVTQLQQQLSALLEAEAA